VQEMGEWPWAGSTHPGMQITCPAINPLSLGPGHSVGQVCQRKAIAIAIVIAARQGRCSKLLNR